MADLKISDLSALSGSDLVAADELAIVDDSASETKKITVSNLIANGVTLISDDAIPGAKILFGAGDIATAALADSAVTAAKIGADQVTAAKIADNTIVNLVSTLPASGDYTGQLALDTDDNSLYVYSGSAWLNTKAPGSVNAFTDTTSGIINISTAVSSGTATVTASIDNTASAAQFLAGPVGSGGTVGYRVIDGGDLPTATTTSKGGVIVNGGGLTLSTDTVQIDNSVTASSTKHLVTYDANGLITGGSVIASSDLPVATSSAKGAVIASDGLAVDASGNLSIDNTVTAGTYTKVTVTSKGVVSSGDTLAAADIPNHSAAKLTSGTISSSLLPNNVVTAGKLADESTVKFGGALGSDNVTIFPAGDFKGQLFWDETSLDLYVYTGSAFIPITVLSGNLVNAGTYNANTNLVSSVTTAGSSAGFAAGSALPAPVGANLNHYVVVETSGTGSGAAPAVALAPPDMLLSNGVGTEYRLIDVSNAIAGQTASNISFIASGTIAATDVQAALQEVDTEKLPKAGGTMTGDLNLGTSTNVVFEGSSADDYETTLTVTNPTADRTITFPNVTGTVVTSGDTGSVTSTMIADGAIVNADINASAEIAVSKLANGTARQLLQTDSGGSGVEFTSNVDVPGTLDVTGNSLFDGTLAVAGVLRANGKLQVFAGTPSSVSICQSISSGDTDTGIYFPTGSGNGIGIASGGAERLFINETGSIGIGAPTSLGNEALRIKSNNSIIAINLDRESDSQSYIRTNANRTAANAFIGGNQYQWNDTTVAAIYAKSGTDTTNKDNGCLTFFTAASGTNTERMRIDEDGTVGIMNSSPTFLLDVGNTTNALGQTAGDKLDNFRLVSDTQNADRLNFTCRRLADGTSWQTAAHRIQRHIDSSFAGYIQFGGFNATAPDLITFGKSNTEYMRIDYLGNVGIGTTSASHQLTVHNASTTGGTIEANRFSVRDNYGNVSGLGNGFVSPAANTLAFATASTERMRITSQGHSMFSPDGNFYGTTSTANWHTFDQPSTAQWTLGLRSRNTSTPYGLIISYANAAPNNASSSFIYAADNSALRFHVKSNGGIDNYDGNNVGLSDEREKKNIAPLNSKWETVKSWELKKFHFNDDEETEYLRYGVIAQQIEVKCPEIVTDWQKLPAKEAVLDEDGNVVTPAEEAVMRKGVKSQQMTWMAIKALQEAQDRIETLEAKVAALEAG